MGQWILEIFLVWHLHQTFIVPPSIPSSPITFFLFNSVSTGMVKLTGEIPVFHLLRLTMERFK